MDLLGKSISERIKELRIAKSLKQSDIDELAKLPSSSTSKIERGMREATADELIRISNALGVCLEAFSGGSKIVYKEELSVVEALRGIPFEDYKRIIKSIESSVYFAAKDAGVAEKRILQDLVPKLNLLTLSDQRPRMHVAEVVRVKRRGEENGKRK